MQQQTLEDNIMDKTLMRPLFRKRATQLRKVDGKAVPKFFLGELWVQEICLEQELLLHLDI
jgi:hypothetical protein